MASESLAMVKVALPTRTARESLVKVALLTAGASPVKVALATASGSQPTAASGSRYMMAVPVKPDTKRVALREGADCQVI